MEFVLEELEAESVWLFGIFTSSSINRNVYPETWENLIAGQCNGYGRGILLQVNYHLILSEVIFPFLNDSSLTGS